MDAASKARYRPPEEFQEDEKDSLIELDKEDSDSKELWLIQWPISQAPDFDGQELSLKLHHDGLLGSFEGSSGKLYDIISFKSQDPNATVFLSSASESKIAGKISRRVSLVHYPEPSEFEKQNANNQKQLYQRSYGTSFTNSFHRSAAPSQVTRTKSSKSRVSNAASMDSSGYRSSLLVAGEPLKTPKRKQHAEEPTRSMDLSAQDSGRGHSIVTSGSVEHNEKKSKKKKKHG